MAASPSYGSVDESLVEELRSILATDRVLDDEASLEEYAQDMSHHDRAVPDLAVRPNCTEEVAAIVRACAGRRIPVIVRGAGTGVEGGCIPYFGGCVIDTSLLKHKALVEGEQLAVVGAGVLKSELNDFLAPHGLLFGPDPSSNPSVGGMASTGGSGMSTLKYGTSKENIVSLVVVTPQGEVLRTRQAVRKASTGYELNALYLGAEGTLGVITELTVRLFPVPAVRCGAVVVFPSVRAAAETVVAAVRAGLGHLLRCELLNDEGVGCTNAVFGTSLEAAPTLFLEFVGGSRDAAEADWAAMRAMAEERGARSHKFAPSGEELDELWDARRGCYLSAMRYRGLRDGSGGKDSVFVGDVCVPVSRLAACIDDTEAEFKRAGFPCVICAHIADGNFHALIPYKPEEKARLVALEDKVIARAIALGGAASGEHGVGVGKIRHICWEHGPLHICLQRRIKRALDPLCLMNPGKIFPLEPSEDERLALAGGSSEPGGSRL